MHTAPAPAPAPAYPQPYSLISNEAGKIIGISFPSSANRQLDLDTLSSIYRPMYWRWSTTGDGKLELRCEPTWPEIVVDVGMAAINGFPIPNNLAIKSLAIEFVQGRYALPEGAAHKLAERLMGALPEQYVENRERRAA